MMMKSAMTIFQLGPPTSFITSSAPVCQRGHFDDNHDNFGDHMINTFNMIIMPAMLNVIISSAAMTMMLKMKI